MLKRVRGSEFARSVMVLMTGTVIAQAISYLIYPLLTRIYSTAEMGELGMYMRIVGFVAAIATARYELSIPIARRDLHAFHLFRLSFRIAIIVLSAVTLIGIVYFLLRPFAWNNMLFLALTMISAYLAVWINLGTNWSIRFKAFRKISNQRIINSFVGNGLKWVFGVFSMGAFGLVLSTLLGSLISAMVFMTDFLKTRKGYKSFAAGKRMQVLGKEYSQFPTVNLPHVLLDLGVDLATAVLIVEYFGEGVFGSYAHAYAMLKLPIAILGQSVGQVFFNKCSELIHANQSVLPLLLKTYRTLFLVSIVPFTLLFFYGEELFAFVFSEKWRESGKLAELMAPWLMLNFIVSPISSLSLILNRQKEMLVIGIASAAGQLLIYGGLPFLLPDHLATIYFLTACTVFYQVFVLFIAGFAYAYFAKAGKPGKN